MAEHSMIEWTDATWNPITGCSIVSPGCTNCYAMKLAGTRLEHHPSRAGLTRYTLKSGPVWTGEVRLNEQWLTQPLKWRRPRMVFVCAHGDLFHESVPDEWIDRVFAVMALAPQHVFQVLTKRSSRMRDYLGTRAGDWMLHWPDAARKSGALLGDVATIKTLHLPLANVWLGVSAEDQRRADERIPDLLATPATVRWVSAEPLIGPIDFSQIDDGLRDGTRLIFDALTGVAHDGEQAITGVFGNPDPKLDWIVVGGESGQGARPMVLGHAKEIVRQCTAAGVSCFVKQIGAKPINREGARHPISDKKGAIMEEWPADLRIRETPNDA